MWGGVIKFLPRGYFTLSVLNLGVSTFPGFGSRFKVPPLYQLNFSYTHFSTCKPHPFFNHDVHVS